MTAHTSKHGKTAAPRQLEGTPSQLSSTWSPWVGACNLPKQQDALLPVDKQVTPFKDVYIKYKVPLTNVKFPLPL